MIFSKLSGMGFSKEGEGEGECEGDCEGANAGADEVVFSVLIKM
jgi:hypothetical protein